MHLVILVTAFAAAGRQQYKCSCNIYESDIASRCRCMCCHCSRSTVDDAIAMMCIEINFSLLIRRMTVSVCSYLGDQCENTIFALLLENVRSSERCIFPAAVHSLLCLQNIFHFIFVYLLAKGERINSLWYSAKRINLMQLKKYKNMMFFIAASNWPVLVFHLLLLLLKKWQIADSIITLYHHAMSQVKATFSYIYHICLMSAMTRRNQS